MNEPAPSTTALRPCTSFATVGLHNFENVRVELARGEEDPSHWWLSFGDGTVVAHTHGGPEALSATLRRLADDVDRQAQTLGRAS